LRGIVIVERGTMTARAIGTEVLRDDSQPRLAGAVPDVRAYGSK